MLKQKLSAVQKRILLLVAIQTLLSVSSFQGIFVLAPLSLLRITGSKLASAHYFTFFSLGALLLIVPAGTIIDRLGRRSGLIIGPLVLVAAILACSLSVSFRLPVVFLGAMVVAGAGVAFVDLNVVSMGDVAPVSRRAELVTIIGLCSAIAYFIGPLLAGYVSNLVEQKGLDPLVHGWAGSLIAAVVALAAAVSVRIDPREVADSIESADHSAKRSGKRLVADRSRAAYQKQRTLPTILNRFPVILRAAVKSLRSRPVLIVVVASAGFTLVRSSMLVSLSPMLIEKGFSTFVSGSLISAMGLGAFIVSLAAGLLSDRMGRKPVLLLIWGISVIGLPLTFFSGSPLVMGVGLICLGAGYAGMLNIGRTVLVDVSSPADRGKLFGLYQATVESTRVASPTIASLVGLAGGWLGIGGLCVLAVAAGGGAVFRLRETKIGMYAQR